MWENTGKWLTGLEKWLTGLEKWLTGFIWLSYVTTWSPYSNKTPHASPSLLCDRDQSLNCLNFPTLTHWGRVMHICVSKLTIIASDNGLSPGRRQAIIWTSAGILLIGPLGTNFSEIIIEIITFSFKKMRLKASSSKWRPCCLSLNVLIMVMLVVVHIMLYWTMLL